MRYRISRHKSRSKSRRKSRRSRKRKQRSRKFGLKKKHRNILLGTAAAATAAATALGGLYYLTRETFVPIPEPLDKYLSDIIEYGNDVQAHKRWEKAMLLASIPIEEFPIEELPKKEFIKLSDMLYKLLNKAINQYNKKENFVSISKTMSEMSEIERIVINGKISKIEKAYHELSTEAKIKTDKTALEKLKEGIKNVEGKVNSKLEDLKYPYIIELKYDLVSDKFTIKWNKAEEEYEYE